MVKILIEIEDDALVSKTASYLYGTEGVIRVTRLTSSQDICDTPSCGFEIGDKVIMLNDDNLYTVVDVQYTAVWDGSQWVYDSLVLIADKDGFDCGDYHPSELKKV